MKEIILLGTGGLNNDNRGCAAFTIGALNFLCSKYPEIKNIVIILIGKQNKTEKNILQINDKNVEVTYEYCNKYDYYNFIIDIFTYLLLKKSKNTFIKLFSKINYIYTINGGDGFTDIYGTKRLLMVFIEFVLALICQKKITLLPQTIGPFTTSLGKFLSKIILKNSAKIYVRDKQANQYLESINVKYTNCFDLSVYMPPEPIKIDIPNDTIGINISGLLYYKTDVTDAKSFDNYEKLIVAIIDELIKLNKKILLIPHTYNSKTPNYADDLSACKEIKNKFNNDNISIIDNDYTAPQLKYIISQCDFFIGSRMHSNFAALSTSTPCIGLGYSYKFQGGFDMFNVSECAISIKNIHENEISKIIQKILKLISSRELFKYKLNKINNNIKESFYAKTK